MKSKVSRWELAIDTFIIGMAVAMWPVADSAGIEFGKHWATLGHFLLSASIVMNLFNGVERIVKGYTNHD